MKTKIILSALAAIGLMTSCADLGFGVDIDSGGYTPYFNGYYGSPWGNIGLNWDYPLYAPPAAPPRPVRPPAINGKPGPVKPPQQAPARPQQPAPGNGVPSVSPGGQVRPGNGGRPSSL